jgi:hypothetical protein
MITEHHPKRSHHTYPASSPDMIIDNHPCLKGPVSSRGRASFYALPDNPLKARQKINSGQ